MLQFNKVQRLCISVLQEDGLLDTVTVHENGVLPKAGMSPGKSVKADGKRTLPFDIAGEEKCDLMLKKPEKNSPQQACGEKTNMLVYLRRHGYAFTAGFLIFGLTLYVLLDTFVIEKIYDDSAGKYAVTQDGVREVSARTAAVTEKSYSDENIKIEISEFRKYDSTIYAAEISLSGPEYMKTAFARGCYGRNIKEPTSKTAESVNAILAVNGDFYGAQEKGYVLRNGAVFRDKAAKGREDLVIYEDGSFGIINESDVSVLALGDAGAYQVLSFGPVLVENSCIKVTEDDETGIAAVCNPRTAIGIIDELHYVFVVADGRSEESRGLRISELAEVMKDLNAVTAYNLDGGGSSTMVFNGSVVNKPTEYGKEVTERGISDIVYIGY